MEHPGYVMCITCSYRNRPLWARTRWVPEGQSTDFIAHWNKWGFGRLTTYSTQVLEYRKHCPRGMLHWQANIEYVTQHDKVTYGQRSLV